MRFSKKWLLVGAGIALGCSISVGQEPTDKQQQIAKHNRKADAIELSGMGRASLDTIKAFEDLVLSWPEVREAHMLAGETDFLLKIVAPDWDSYQRFLSDRLTSAPNVNQVKSALVLRVSKSAPGVPLADSEEANAPHPVPLPAIPGAGPRRERARS